jgi:hypothetical protein
MSLTKRVLPGEANQELDEAGRALRDRLIRLGSKKSSAYTALSLLKAYGSFKIGACLDINDDGSYRSYAIVGLGIAKLNIVSLAGLLQEDQAFFKIPNPQSLNLKFYTPGMNLWVFALDDSSPCRCLLLAAEESGSAFRAETIARILSETNEVFFPTTAPAEPQGFDLALPPEAEGPEPLPQAGAPEPASPAPPVEHSAEPVSAYAGVDTVTEAGVDALAGAAAQPATAGFSGQALETAEEARTKIAELQNSNAVSQAILLEVPGGAPGHSFGKQVATMIGVLGISFSLPSRRILILRPRRFDRELIAHRLSVSFATEVLACFGIEDPDQALELIQAYL